MEDRLYQGWKGEFGTQQHWSYCRLSSEAHVNLSVHYFYLTVSDSRNVSLRLVPQLFPLRMLMSVQLELFVHVLH